MIVNADSVQLYQKLNIGTAKPSSEDFNRVRHYLFDCVEPPEQITAGEYHRKARDIVFEELKQQPVFLVGGSGFYVQAFEKGMLPSPKTPPDVLDELNQQLEDKGVDSLFAELEQRDSEYSKRVSRNDSYRVIRALSIMRTEGKSMTEIAKQFAEEQKQKRIPVQPLKIGLQVDRDVLRERVRKRCQGMIEAGLKQEVEELLDKGLKDWAPMTSVGYKETVAHIKGELSETEWLEHMVTSTMQLAKRQKTWFNREKEIRWFNVTSELDQAAKVVSEWLEKTGNTYE